MIDWFTIVAQIVNFLILVGLLKYFLYGRVIDAMEKREQEIASSWDEVNLAKEEAQQQRDLAEQHNRELEDQRQEELVRVHEEVEAHRRELTAKVREEVDQVKARWSAAIREESASFLRDLRRRASEEVFAVARRVLDDLADTELERRIAEKFIALLNQLGDPQRNEVMASLWQGENTVVVQSAFALPEDLQQRIAETLRTRFVDSIEVTFEQAPALICGIAIQTNSHKLAWELDDYLTGLEESLHAALEEETLASASNA